MKMETRREGIVDLLVEQGSATLDEMAARFGVSKMTIHRDLDDLEEAGLLRKVRGGASIESSSQFESDYRTRARRATVEKRRIARAAAALVEPGMTVLVNDGSTAGMMAEFLPARRPLTVITNNMAVIAPLTDAPGVTLMALGGVYSRKFNGFFGIVTEESLSRLRADVAFISASAVSGAAAYHQDQEVVQAKRLMAAAAERRYLLVDHGKFGRSALHFLADLAGFDGVVTGAPLAAEHTAPLREAGVNLIVAEGEA